MPGERLSMRKIREVLRLRFGHDLRQRAIARSLQLSRCGERLSQPGTPRRNNLAVAGHAETTQLEALLFPPLPDVPIRPTPGPGLGRGHRELRRPNVTLALLWEEYRARPPTGLATAVMLRPYLCCAPRSDFRTYRSAAFS